MTKYDTPDLILASSSTYRQAQLRTLSLPFRCVVPEISEDALPYESPAGLARRLALQKAQAIAKQFPDSIVIGADQVLNHQLNPLGKPMTHARAFEQLTQLSGQTVVFHSAVALISAQTQQIRCVDCRAQFRTLTPAQIQAYLKHERPYDTAGSAKAEGLGITLLASLESNDPSAIIGLPLIALTDMLSRIGLNPLEHISSHSTITDIEMPSEP